MTTGDEAARRSIVATLRPLAGSLHPDVRRDGLQILAALPADEMALAADLVVGWLAADEFFPAAHLGQQIVLSLASAGEVDACLKVAEALYRLFDRNGEVTTMFSSHMYEHYVFTNVAAITRAVGLDALKLFCELLFNAAVMSKKLTLNPLFDHTTFSSFSLPKTEADLHDYYGALTNAVLQSATVLLDAKDQNTQAVIDELLRRPYRVYQRIALNVISDRPEALPVGALN